MARQEVDKEDLLREATALVDRVELAIKDDLPSGLQILVGFRTDGGASIFFGADPVYHFNAMGELRRAYCEGFLFKAERGRLVSLRRERNADEVQLIRHELSDIEQVDFLRQMQTWLQRVARAIVTREYEVVGRVGGDRDIIGRIARWLSSRDAIVVAASPRV